MSERELLHQAADYAADFLSTLGERPIRPYLALAGGVHYIKAQGLPQTDVEPAAEGSALSGLLAGGGGVSARFFPWLALEASALALFALPPTNVTVHGNVVGMAGAPSVLATLALSLAFASF